MLQGWNQPATPDRCRWSLPGNEGMERTSLVRWRKKMRDYHLSHDLLLPWLEHLNQRGVL